MKLLIKLLFYSILFMDVHMLIWQWFLYAVLKENFIRQIWAIRSHQFSKDHQNPINELHSESYYRYQFVQTASWPTVVLNSKETETISPKCLFCSVYLVSLSETEWMAKWSQSAWSSFDSLQVQVKYRFTGLIQQVPLFFGDLIYVESGHKSKVQ